MRAFHDAKKYGLMAVLPGGQVAESSVKRMFVRAEEVDGPEAIGRWISLMVLGVVVPVGVPYLITWTALVLGISLNSSLGSIVMGSVLSWGGILTPALQTIPSLESQVAIVLTIVQWIGLAGLVFVISRKLRLVPALVVTCVTLVAVGLATGRVLGLLGFRVFVDGP